MPVMTLSCDLPFLTVDDLAALIVAGGQRRVAACDTEARAPTRCCCDGRD